MAGPMDGIRVFDWTLAGVGPFASSILARLGAEVIKIDAPPPRFFRHPPPTQRGEDVLYMAFNMGKKGIMLDLQSQEGKETAFRLLEKCDVFLNNMRSDVPDRLGLGYGAVSQINPRILYCQSSGWGKEGPMARVGAGDPTVQAFSGWNSLNGKTGGRPEMLRALGQVDFTVSAYIVSSILEALVARDRTGLGQRIDMTMLGSAMAVQSTRLAEYFATGENPPRMGSACVSTVPHQAFLCLDHEFLAVGVVEDGQWQRLCSVLGSSELADDQRYATNSGRVTNREELVPALEAIFATRPIGYWMLKLSQYKVPNARFMDFDGFRHHAQYIENGFITEVETGKGGKVFATGLPWKFSKTVGQSSRPPLPGEHTAEVIQSIPSMGVAPETKAAKPLPSSSASRGPLHGLRALELASGLAGPYCGQLLGDAGCEVTKVDPPGGDYTRGWGPPDVRGVSAAFLAINRNKKGIVLDTANQADRDALQELIRDTDIVVADWSAGGEAPTFTYEELAAINPQVIYCTISPHGEAGPWKDLPGSELTIQALTNCWAGLGVIGEEPVRIGTDQAGMVTGIYALQGILAALHSQARTGEGQHVAVSQLGVMMFTKNIHWSVLSDVDEWVGPYCSYRTDPPIHGYMMHGMSASFSLRRSTEEEYIQLLMELEMTDYLDDPRFANGGRAALFPGKFFLECTPIWEEAFAKKTPEELNDIFVRYGIEMIPWNSYQTLLSHPQIEILSNVIQLEHPDGGTYTGIAPPFTLSYTPNQPARLAAPVVVAQAK